MKVSDELATAAFVARGKQETKWPLKDSVHMWEVAGKVMSDATTDRLAEYWASLRRFQTFRNSKNVMKPEQALPLIKCAYKATRDFSLTGLDEHKLHSLNHHVTTCSSIKRNKGDTPSLVAVSKVLHFINPHLFVIMDQNVMVNYVFRHSWLREQLPQDFNADVDHYIDFLSWCGDLLRQNPSIMRAFRIYLHRRAEREKTNLPIGADNFEGVAVEWFLQGVSNI